MKNCIKKNLNLDGKNVDAYYPKNGGYINIYDLANSTYNKRTTFNYALFDFKDLFGELINSSETENNFKEKNVFCLPQTESLDKDFSKIKDYSNVKSVLIHKVAVEVLNSFKKIYQELDNSFSWTEEEYFIVPLKGGGFVINMFEINDKNILAVEAKRVPFKKTGYLGLGLHLDSNSSKKINYFMDNIPDKEVVFLEVCIASGMTTIGFILDLYIKGIRPSKIKILTAAASLQGIKVINKIANLLNYKVEFYTGQLIENVGDFYDVSQDSIVYSDGAFVVKSPEKAYKIVYGI